MDSWSAIHLKMMQAGGNDALNKFMAARWGGRGWGGLAAGLAAPSPADRRPRARDRHPQQYGVSKSTDARDKYAGAGASAYRDKIKAAAEGRPWSAPPVEPRGGGGGGGGPPPRPAARVSASGTPGGGGARGGGGFDEPSWGWDDSPQQPGGAPATCCGRPPAAAGRMRPRGGWQGGGGGGAAPAHVAPFVCFPAAR